MWATSIIFKKLPKVNNHLLDENSPNLVTLIVTVKVMSYVRSLPTFTTSMFLNGFLVECGTTLATNAKRPVFNLAPRGEL
jgi:hypothetical protein